MANEVSFFHAMRKMSITKELEKNERILRLIERSKDSWKDDGWEEEYEYEQIEKSLIESIEKGKAALEECEADLQQAMAERK